MWLMGGKIRIPHIKVATYDFPATERSLGDADVLAARSLLTPDVGVMRTDAEAALAIDRTNVLARLIKTALTNSIAPDDARATAAAPPTTGASGDWSSMHCTALPRATKR